MFDAQARLNLNFLIERGVLNADGSASAPGSVPAQVVGTSAQAPGQAAQPTGPLARGSGVREGGSPTTSPTTANLGPWMPSIRNIEVFQRLLDILGLPTSIASTVAQRLLASRQSKADAGEDRPVALPLMRTIDLIGLRGIDAATVEALDPFVTFLPSPPGGSTSTPVNLNTAPAEVLAALVEDLDLSTARRLVIDRERKWFNRVEDFRSLIPVTQAQTTLRADLMATTTQYFLVRGLIRFGRVESFTETLLHRQTQRVEVIWQRRL